MSVTVDISDFAFVEAEVHVAVGGSVTWTNSDDADHTATGDAGFDTGTIKPGESAAVTFDAAGSYAYVCGFHSFMVGSVVVG